MMSYLDALVASLRRSYPDKGQAARHLAGRGAIHPEVSKAEQNKPHWQAAAEAVIMAAEDREPSMHADIDMKRALNAGKPAEFDPKQKSPIGKTGAQEGSMKDAFDL
jgi:hypothetical protein